MAVQPKTPQEKKCLSYEKDRHTQNHVLATAVGIENSDALAAVENLVRSTEPRDWRKFPDTSLGEVLSRKANK